MRYYSSIDSMWMDALEHVSHSAVRETRNGPARRVFGWQARLNALEQRTLLMNERRAISPAYAAAETLWYLGRRSDVGFLLPFAPSYKQYAEPSGHAHGAYGGRIRPSATTIDQIGGALNILRGDMHSRQAVISLWQARDLTHAVRADKKDLPCTLALQLSVNDCGRLDMMCTMRSNDLWLGFPYDVFAFTCVQHIIANELTLEVGEYVHSVGDLHLYEKNVPAAFEAVKLGEEYNFPHRWAEDSFQEQVASCIDRVEDHRPPADGTGNMLHDLVIACANHGRPHRYSYCSPAFRLVEKNHVDRRGS